MKRYKIRIYSATMETKYGFDGASIYDDPDNPKYSENDAIKKLMEDLDYTPNEDGYRDPPGTYADDVAAYFEFIGATDIEIPRQIVEKIISDYKETISGNKRSDLEGIRRIT